MYNIFAYPVFADSERQAASEEPCKAGEPCCAKQQVNALFALAHRSAGAEMTLVVRS